MYMSIHLACPKQKLKKHKCIGDETLRALLTLTTVQTKHMRTHPTASREFSQDIDPKSAFLDTWVS